MKLCRQCKTGNEKLRQFVRFCLVGISNTAVYFVVYYLLLFCHIPYLIANFIGWVVSVGNAYIWSRRYVFADSRLSGQASLWRVYVSYALTLLLSTGSLYVLVQYCGFSDKIAPWLIYVLTVPLNFLLNKYWVFPK